MKVLYKNKILVNGLFPMKNYSIDGYTEKTAQYNDTIINLKENDNFFYGASPIIYSLYQPVGKEELFYEYLENDDYFNLEIPDDIAIDNLERDRFILHRIIEKIDFLEKKLRLITNMKIGLPMFKITIYDENAKYISQIGYIKQTYSIEKIYVYNDLYLRNILESRLNLYIDDNDILSLEKNNDRYGRALNFYNNSFLHSDYISFTLLFSALESLFNINGKDVAETVSNYTSKIFFLSCMESIQLKYKVKKYYTVRSKYIHGNNKPKFDNERLFNLREIVRKVLLIYWKLSSVYHITNAKKIVKLINSNTKIDDELKKFISNIEQDNTQDLYQKLHKNFTDNKVNLFEINKLQ